MKRLVVTGDDFGLSPRVNRAIIEAHEHGILTGASLMIGAPAAREAVALAREHPGLAVGLHLVVLDGPACSPPAEISRLADPHGTLRRSPFRAGVLYQFSREARRQLQREIRAQLEAFRETGLPLSHVDGHHHMHLHPFILGVLIDLAREFGIRWIRLPSEELGQALAAEKGRAAEKIFWSTVFALLRRSGERRLRAAGIGFPQRVYGLLMTGRIREDYLLHLLPRIRAAVSELYCHPIQISRSNSRSNGEEATELDALVSEAVMESLAHNGIQLTSFATLSPGAPAGLAQSVP